jgi:uncharacterized protein YpmB
VKKIAAAAAALLVLLLVGAGFYYRAIQKDHSAQLEDARRTALAQTDLAYVERVWRFAGDDVYYVAYGTDAEDRPLYVWIGAGEAAAYPADSGIGGDEAAERTKQAYGDADILRVVPGMLDGEPVWEVFYEREEENGVRRYYDYYRFRDGTLVDTLRLKPE